MCLRIAKYKHPLFQPIILDKSIFVYKIASNLGYYSFQSRIYENFKYKRNKITKKEELTPIYSKDGRYAFIEKGYHAYFSYMLGAIPVYNIGRFEIPSGTKVYFGINGDIVAEQIIYLGPCYTKPINLKKTSIFKKIKHIKTIIKWIKR